jgi:hypothetical protein
VSVIRLADVYLFRLVYSRALSGQLGAAAEGVASGPSRALHPGLGQAAGHSQPLEDGDLAGAGMAQLLQHSQQMVVVHKQQGGQQQVREQQQGASGQFGVRSHPDATAHLIKEQRSAATAAAAAAGGSGWNASAKGRLFASLKDAQGKYYTPAVAASVSGAAGSGGDPQHPGLPADFDPRAYLDYNIDLAAAWQQVRAEAARGRLTGGQDDGRGGAGQGRAGQAGRAARWQGIARA